MLSCACRSSLYLLYPELISFVSLVFTRQGSPYSPESVPITLLYGKAPLVCPSPTGIISIKRISVPFFAAYRVSSTTSVCGVSTTFIFTLIPHSMAASIPCSTSSSSGFFVIRSYSDASIVSRLTFMLSMPASLNRFACCASSTAFVVSDTLLTPGIFLICKTISSICGCRSGSPPVRRKCVIPILVAARTMQSTFFTLSIFTA